MANCCCTDIWIRGDHESANKIWDELQKVQENFSPRGIPERALLEHIGLEAKNACCRGTVVHMDRHGDKISLSQDDAWTPNLGPVSLFCDKIAPESVEMTYLAIEPGCGIFDTNDADYEDMWLLDLWNTDDLPDCFAGLDYEFMSDNDLNTLLKKALGYKGKFSLRMLIQAALDRWCENMSINKIEYVDSCEYI